MTSLELKNEFEFQYNSNASNAARGLDDYEISLLLTTAQEKLVKRYMQPRSNMGREGFEGSEKRRRDLSQLVVKRVAIGGFDNASSAISGRSKFFYINDEVMFVTHETLKIKSDDTCLNATTIDIKPVTRDEYNYNIKNPFKKPSDELAWRLDYSRLNGNRVVEIIPGENYVPFEYNYTYVKRPRPIIISDLSLIDTTISINGQTAESLCELNEEVQREIIDLAVELAQINAGDPRSQVTAQSNLRNE
jgi:hypothetical protein